VLATGGGASVPWAPAPPPDDAAAPWSAWGYTADGFLKPELGAPGRYLIGNVPDHATLMQQRAQNKVGPNKLELSGTSFSAGIVSGIVDDLLTDHPDWTPGMVKGALMVSAQLTAQPNTQLGVGEANFAAADAVAAPPNPNAALDVFVSAGDGDGSGPAFDAVAWASAASSNAAWSSAAWSSVAWSSAAWSSVAWSSAAWSSVAWSSAAWSSVAWSSVAWSSVAWSSAAWSDYAADDGLGDS
jgi:hypothetical protein